MPAEAATNVMNIIQLLYTPQNGSGAHAQHHAHFFGADFIVPLDERDDFCIQIVLSDTLTAILGDILPDTLRDTVIQVRHNDRKLVAVRSECRALILGVVDLRFVAVQNFTEAAALALHIAQTVEHIGQHRVAPGGRHGKRVAVLDHRPIRHTARRVDLQTVIVDVNVDLAAVDEIIAVRQRVDKRLMVVALDVFGQFLPRVRRFAPHHACECQ